MTTETKVSNNSIAETQSKEIWKDVPGYEGWYEISNLGRVKSLNYARTGKEKLLKISKNGRGYSQVCLSLWQKKSVLPVHKLVAMTFLGHEPCGAKEIVDHKNNDKSDNRVKNLQLTTTRVNTSKDKKGCTSKYTGVYWSNPSKKWMARIRVGSEERYLGLHENEQDAHIAYQTELNRLNPGSK